MIYDKINDKFGYLNLTHKQTFKPLKRIKYMKKTLATLALGIALNLHAGLEELPKDNRAIISQTSGSIDVPFGLVDYAKDVQLTGKLARALADSPYIYGLDENGKSIFYDNNGVTSRVEIAKDYCTTNSFRKEVGISGTRSLTGDFKAFLVLNCRRSENQIKYESTMYTVLESGLARRLTKGLQMLPYFGRKVQRFFENEQNGVVQMMDQLGKKIKENPYGFINAVQNGTNGVTFSDSEKAYVKKSLIDNGFLK